MSHVVEGMRQFVLLRSSELSASAFLKAWGIPAIGSVLALALCLRALRRRLNQS